MESFAKQLGGTLEVETTTEGTRVGVRFPMATAKEAA
jgi:signal transduction histidine kinase